MYKPLPNFIKIKKSSISGVGLFATKQIKAETNLGVSHIKDNLFEDGYIRTPLGGFINHSNNPNCSKRSNDTGYLYLFTDKAIEKNEELTTRYTLYSLK